MNLIDRIGSDTITKLERASAQRFDEATDLLPRRHHLAAIYLCGYAAEMVIGSAYMKILGFRPNQEIPGEIRRLAVRQAGLDKYRVLSHRSHPLDGWARLLVDEKRESTPPGYSPDLGRSIIGRIDSIARHWWPHLRYRDFEATEGQANEVLDATRWLLTHSPIL